MSWLLLVASLDGHAKKDSGNQSILLLRVLRAIVVCVKKPDMPQTTHSDGLIFQHLVMYS